jgi:hypothetical protein
MIFLGGNFDMKTIQIFLISFLSCIFATTAYASNYSFLNDSPISNFTSQDTAMMSANIQTALDLKSDDKKSSWKNPNTGAWGYAIPSHTTRQNGTICRNLTVFNEAKKIPGMSTYTYCKINGIWKITQ